MLVSSLSKIFEEFDVLELLSLLLSLAVVVLLSLGGGGGGGACMLAARVSSVKLSEFPPLI